MLASFRSLLWRASRSFSVAWLLVQREIMSEFHASRMSLLWPVIYPLAYTLLLVFMRPVLGAAAASSTTEFAIFVFIGFSLWQSWFEVLRAQMDAVRKNKSLMARAELGAATLFISTTLSAGLHMLPRIVVGSIAAWLLISADASAIAILFVGSLLILLNGAVIGAALQPFSTLSPDLGKAVQSISLGLLMTGAVFIPMPDQPPRAMLWLISANPLGALLNLARAPLLGDPWLVTGASLSWALATLVLMTVLLVVGRRLLPILIERIGN